MTRLDTASPRIRGGDWSVLKWEWPKRATAALEYLAEVQSVADIGCGRMTMRAMLPESVKYLGVDVVPRGEDTLVVDLNSQPLPQIDAEAAIVLGVLEYLDVPEHFFTWLEQFEQVVMSYNCHSLKDHISSAGYGNIPDAWRNRLKRKDIISLLEKHGFQIEAERNIRYAEYLWSARRA